MRAINALSRLQRFAKLVLHSSNVQGELVLSSDLLTRREVIDLLVFIKTFVEIRLAGARRPQQPS